MRVISLVTQKGGSSKSTLTFCLAVAAEEASRRVLILDMDPQGTVEAWYQVREAETPRLATVRAAQLQEAIQKAAQAGFDLVLIDTPGRDEPAVTAAIKTADYCIIPCRPTAADMKATPPTVAAVKRLDKPFAFVLTQTPPRGYRIREAEIGLSVLGPVAPITMTLRNAYQDALGAGLGVTELESEGKATEEIRALWEWTAKKMEKLTS